MELDEIARMNQRVWDREVELGKGCTQPWLDLDVEAFQAFRDGETPSLPASCFDERDQAWITPDIAGREVLCLASGGGQQSAAFSLLGARVTVLDLSDGQLRGDREAADHYGYEVTTIQGDMRDLSIFGDGSFDAVVQAISIVFVPEVRPVYREVFRVLRPGGHYDVAHCDPATFAVDLAGPLNGWDGVGYRIAEPYVGGPARRRPDGSESMTEGEPFGEFRHLLKDIFNGLIETGFVIRAVWEDPRHLRHDADAEPGTEAHKRNIVALYFSILAQKPE